MEDITPVPGVIYYNPPAGSKVSGLDGKVVLSLGPEPVPLLEEDCRALDGEAPGYDAVGRGIYQVLRTDPGCRHCERYAEMLKGYPHYVSELASHILMLGEKDVEVPYLERRVKLLRIFALMEPENANFPMEIGATLLEQGLRFSALHLSTVTLFKAEAYLDRALRLSPDLLKTKSTLAEVAFLLGKYQKAALLWRGLQPELDPASAGEHGRCLVRPRVPDGRNTIPSGALLRGHGSRRGCPQLPAPGTEAEPRACRGKEPPR